MFNPKPLNSCNNTLNDSGIPGVGIGSPLTIVHKIFDFQQCAPGLVEVVVNEFIFKTNY